MSDDLIRRSDAIEAIYEARRAMPLKGVFTDTMSWAIARANAIPTIEAVPKDFHDQTCEAMAKRHTEEIQRLMPKRGEWIPCSERLPKENGRYLVTFPSLINKPWIDILWYGRPTFPETDHPCFYASDDECGDVEYDDVVAWMPLPQPYGEREGE